MGGGWLSRVSVGGGVGLGELGGGLGGSWERGVEPGMLVALVAVGPGCG